MPQWNQHRYCIGEINHVNTFLTNHKRTQRITAKRRVLEPPEAFKLSSHSDKSRSQFETKNPPKPHHYSKRNQALLKPFESHLSVVAYVFVTRFTSYEISFFCLQVIYCELRSDNGLLRHLIYCTQKSGATFCRQQVLPYKHLSHQNDSNFSQFFLPRSNMYIVWGFANSLIYMHCHLDCWSEHSPPRTAYLAPGIS